MFSTAQDLATFCRWLLRRADGMLPDATLHELFTNCAPTGMRGRSIGFDMEPQPGFSPESIMHTGWSGQTLVIDPTQGVFSLVLTNRGPDWELAKKARRQAAALMLKVGS